MERKPVCERDLVRKNLLGGFLPALVLCCIVLLGASTSFAALHAKGSTKGPGGTLHLSASRTSLAYNKKELTSKPGKVTIRFANPVTLAHSVAIEGPEGKEIAVSALISKGRTSVSARLRRGTYKFFCIVPGHREAGMEGTLTVR
jgi:plastocyanin